MPGRSPKQPLLDPNEPATGTPPDKQPAADLLPGVYAELRRLAAALSGSAPVDPRTAA